MQKTSFIEILRTFDKAELKRFESFISSPYFNTKSSVVEIFKIVKKYAPDYDNNNLNKEEIWKKMFPGKEYNYGFFKNIIYDITKLVERFLEVEYLNSEENQRMFNLLNKLYEKHLDNIFTAKYSGYEKNKILSAKFHDNLYKDHLEVMKIKFYFEAINPKLKTRFIATDIAELMILEFMSGFSNNYNGVYISESELNEKPDNDFVKVFSKTIFNNTELDKYIESLNKGPKKDYKMANIFFRIMKCYMNPDKTDYYFDLKKALFENDKYISESALRGLYACMGSALDNCRDTANINKNKELFELIRHLVEKNIFLAENGKVIPSLYLLSVKLAGYLKEPEFIEKMTEEFISKMSPDLQENSMIYSKAFLHYAKNEFDKSLDYIGKINIDTFQMKYFLKNLQIIISYEINDFEMFLFLQDSHKHFLSKNKSVSKSYRESNMKFLSYTNALFKLKESKDISELELIRKDMLKDVMVNKYWLIEKLEEFSN
ncbi:MAG: hypothetical protein KDD00_15240 [Ignavibacteriae bacterium]|nr:hypothetical protein [Ignavibacteriota bacterium]